MATYKSALFIFFSLFALGVELGLVSCTQATPASQTAPPPPASTGIVLSLGERPVPRTILGAPQSSDLANYFEVLVSSTEGLQTALLSTAGGSTTLAVEPGVYTVVVLTGYRRSETASTVLLLASAAAESVVVVQGSQTSVELTLRPIDFEFNTSGSAVSGSTLSVQASGNSRNTHVGMSLAGASTTLRPRLRSTALWNGYHEFQTVAGTETEWTASLSFTVPNVGATIDLHFQGPQVSLVDCGTNSGPLGGKTLGNWKWLNRADMIDGGPLVNLVELNPAIVPPSTGVTIAVTWE